MAKLRGSALWGNNGNDGSRGSALWGKGPRSVSAALMACMALAIPAAGLAGGPGDLHLKAAVPQTLLDEVQRAPDAEFSIIVQGDGAEKSDKLVAKLGKSLVKDQGLKGPDAKAFLDGLKSQFDTIDGVAATVPGKVVLNLARQDGVASITPDSRVISDDGPNNRQKWIEAIGAKWYWGSPYMKNGQAPTIAFIDSGIDNSSGNFDNRLLASVDMGGGSSAGDPRGHGTFVASVAAASGSYSGVAPTAKLVSVDVFNAAGQARTSDVIRACDWVLQNKERYNIRVVNFSLQTSVSSSFLYDPLDQAVEKLWESGIVVVAAAGNYAHNSQASGVLYAPGNDPFVITVGATDINRSPNPNDDFNAPWTSYGYTNDGFAKPEVGAPGRYMIAQIPAGATIRSAYPPANGLKGGYFELSGTSFSAPVVSGIAADLLAAHPQWTPAQVKGAIMLTANTLKNATPRSLGVGEANVQRALEQYKDDDSGTPPNPNRALEAFLVADPSGGPLPIMNGDAWKVASAANPSWNSASWSSASWSSASWSSASWSSASWSSASWTSASWTSASWTSASWSSASWTNNAADDGLGDG